MRVRTYCLRWQIHIARVATCWSFYRIWRRFDCWARCDRIHLFSWLGFNIISCRWGRWNLWGRASFILSFSCSLSSWWSCSTRWLCFDSLWDCCQWFSAKLQFLRMASFQPDIIFRWFWVLVSNDRQRARWSLPSSTHFRLNSSSDSLISSQIITISCWIRMIAPLPSCMEWHQFHHIWTLPIRCIDCYRNYPLMTHHQTHFPPSNMSSSLFRRCSRPWSSDDWRIQRMGRGMRSWYSYRMICWSNWWRLFYNFNSWTLFAAE